MELKKAIEGLKYSIVVVSYNTIAELSICVQSIFRHTKNFELIIVDNASKDGTQGYLKSLAESKDNVKVIFNEENRNFGPANNQGLGFAEGEKIILLNSDTVVTPEWAESMAYVMDNNPKTAIVGPVSNCSNGRQGIGDQFSDQNAELFSNQWRNDHQGEVKEVGILYGWCLLVNREFLKDEEYLFDEVFVNSYEDNDLSIRAAFRGWKLLIDYSTFIYHRGQASFQKAWTTDFLEKYMDNGKINQKKYFNKWKNTHPQKLVAIYRIANCDQYLKQSLDQTSKFADEIICLVARSSDKTEEIARSYDKVSVVEVWEERKHPFNEQAERDWLLQAAIKVGADWIISIDGDEVYEDKFVKNVQAYMNPSNPELQGYWCNWRTIWAVEDGVEKFRADGIFGGFQNYRFFKVLPGMEIKENKNIYNHHCGSAPSIPEENLGWLNIRVKHLGYDTHEQRKRKHEFYLKNDPNPIVGDVGNKDYHHLVDRTVQLKTYRENNKLTIMTVCYNEAEHIYQMLENVAPIADEYVIVDTGSTDGTIEEIKRFADMYKKPVNLINKTFPSMKDGHLYNYSEAKNFAKSQCTTEWILNMDCDELFAMHEVTQIFGMIDEEVDAILFKAINYLSPPKGKTPEENEYALSETIRLYRNIPELYYTGLIHESLEDSLGVRRRRGHAQAVISPIPLHHRGYLKKKEVVREKGDRYHEINLEQFKVSGDKDPRPLFNMSAHYLNDGEEIKALECLGQALEIRPNFWRARMKLAYYYLNLGKQYLNDSTQNLDKLYKTPELDNLVKYLNQHQFKAKKTG